MIYISTKIEKILEQGDQAVVMLRIPGQMAELMSRRRCTEVQLAVEDGRLISPVQRRKAYATLRDISNYTGYTVEAAKEIMKVEHMLRTGGNELLSLRDCTMTEAREFINTLMEYALKEGLVLTESGLMRTDDSDTYLIQCIRYRRCCICGRPAEIHHVDAIGMGRDRRRVDDSRNEVAALCRLHHTIAHQKGWQQFMDLYRVYGIERFRIKGGKEAVTDEQEDSCGGDQKAAGNT